MNFKYNFDKKIKYCEHLLDNYIPSDSEYPHIIFEAMRYSVFAGGKRLRPIMLISSCELFSYDIKNSEPFAVAIELIHTYSLVHDDLPAMDNDDYRRGLPTSHKKFGEDIAILTGDALLHLAFDIMSGACLSQNDINSIKAMNVISNGAGVYGMLSGQVVDVCSENRNNFINDKKILDFIHRKKTASMIASAFKAGAILGKADDKSIQSLYTVGEKIGLAFQIQDDILDIVGDSKVLGKSIGSDKKNNKLTYVSIYGLEKSKEDVNTLLYDAIDILSEFGKKAEFLVELTKYLIKRDY